MCRTSAFLLTMTACLAAAVVSFFGMVLAMNGYSESDASWGMGVFAALAILTALLAGGGAFLMTSRLAAKQFATVKSLLISVSLFSVVGSLLVAVCSMIGILVAELVRTSF